ncbi:MAG: V-type ATP synthase subunit E family protein [Thermoplasmata archaeon]
MGLEVMLEELEKECAQEEKDILDKAKKEAEEILSHAKHEVESILLSSRAEALEEADRLYKERLASLEIEVRKLSLTNRKKMLEQVYDMVLERIKNLDSSTNQELFLKLMKKVLEQIPSGKIYCKQEYSRLVAGFSGFTYAGEMQMIGGLVAENSDGTMSIDYRYETILEEVWEKKATLLIV